MHPAMSYGLAQAHVADLRDRAQRDTLARAARLARRNQRGHALSSLGARVRRAQAGLIARMTRRYQRRRDARVVRTQRPLPTHIGTCHETCPHYGPPDPNSGWAGDGFVLIRGVVRTSTRAYPVLTSPSEEGHAHNPD
jgi:hypothetical protein